MLLFTASIKIQPKLSNEVTNKSGRISFKQRKRIAHRTKPACKKMISDTKLLAPYRPAEKIIEQIVWRIPFFAKCGPCTMRLID